MVDQFRPEARPLIAKLAAVLLTLLAELPIWVTVLVAIIFSFYLFAQNTC
jgi:hypothetical protein